MTNNEDWTTFCEMMAAAGWEYDKAIKSFVHKMTNALYDDKGEYWRNGHWIKIRDWRTWLEAGQTPPPW